MRIFKNVLLSLLAVSVLNGCGGFVGKPTIQVAPKLSLPAMPTDKELGCLPVKVFSSIIIRDSGLSGRVRTLEGQIDAHNSKYKRR